MIEYGFKKISGVFSPDRGRGQCRGACSPADAHRAILAEETIGLMLPCNVIVYENGAETAVAFIKPAVAMAMIQNPELAQIARDVEARLQKAFDAL